MKSNIVAILSPLFVLCLVAVSLVKAEDNTDPHAGGFFNRDQLDQGFFGELDVGNAKNKKKEKGDTFDVSEYYKQYGLDSKGEPIKDNKADNRDPHSDAVQRELARHKQDGREQGGDQFGVNPPGSAPEAESTKENFEIKSE
jgi:hypothetical protein